MSSLSNTEKSKLLFQMGLLWSLIIIVGVTSNKESLAWLFVNPDTYHKAEGRILSSNIGGGGVWSGWRFEITYEYTINGQKFISTRVHFGYQAMSNRSYAQGYVDKYFVGKRIVVFYDPSNPRKSVLEPQIKWYGVFYLYSIVILISLFLFGLSFRFYIARR